MPRGSSRGPLPQREGPGTFQKNTPELAARLSQIYPLTGELGHQDLGPVVSGRTMPSLSRWVHRAEPPEAQEHALPRSGTESNSSLMQQSKLAARGVLFSIGGIFSVAVAIFQYFCCCPFRLTVAVLGLSV